MNGKPQPCLYLLLIQLLYGIPQWAQDPDQLRNTGESLLMEGHESGQVEAWCEELEELGAHHLDLNRATEGALEASGLFTPYQVRMFLQYRDKYGALLSVYELLSVEGFSPSHIEELLLHVRTGTSYPYKRWGTRKAGFHGSLHCFAGTTLPRSAAYGSENMESIYAGSPLNTSLRLDVRAGPGIRTGLAYQKDPGEKAMQNLLPEHLSAFLAYEGEGILEQCMLGNFRLHFGTGLLMGTGVYSPVMQMTERPLLRSFSRPSAGNSEWGIHRGLVLGLRPGPLSLTFWSSFQKTDLGLSNYNPSGESVDWQVYFRESGLHRTALESAGRDLAYKGHGGINTEYRGEQVRAGLICMLEYNGLTARGKDSLALKSARNIYPRTSVYGSWTHGKMQFFAELCPGRKEHTGLLGGMRWKSAPFLGLLLQGWHYGRNYRDSYSESFSHASRQQDEQGLILLLDLEPTAWLKAKLSLELYQHPGIRTDHLPLQGHRLNLTFKNPGTNSPQWRVRLYRQSQSGSGDSVSIRLDGRIAFRFMPGFRWLTALSLPGLTGSGEVINWAMLQEMGWDLGKKFKLTAQSVLFYLPADQGHSVWFYRPAPYRHFSFPAYRGYGNSLSLFLSCRFSTNIILEGNIYRLNYYDRAYIGSGRDETEGPIRLGMNLQLRLKF